MAISRFIFVAILAMTISGCSTAEGLKKDFGLGPSQPSVKSAEVNSNTYAEDVDGGCKVTNRTLRSETLFRGQKCKELSTTAVPPVNIIKAVDGNDDGKNPVCRITTSEGSEITFPSRCLNVLGLGSDGKLKILTSSSRSASEKKEKSKLMNAVCALGAGYGGSTIGHGTNWVGAVIGAAAGWFICDSIQGDGDHMKAGGYPEYGVYAYGPRSYGGGFGSPFGFGPYYQGQYSAEADYQSRRVQELNRRFNDCFGSGGYWCRY